jgi:predicted Fe-Mo cluster-binding NifX family protein
MKLAVTARGTQLDSPVDIRFGRAEGFLVVDLDAGTVEYVPNGEAAAAGQGAGIQAAKLMATHGVQVVLTGHCGPNAFRALQAAGIRVCAGLTGGSIREAVEQFKAGALQEAAGADVQGHW